MILGLGATGCSVARFWQRNGIPFKACDTRPEMESELLHCEATAGAEQVLFGDFDPVVVDGLTELVVSPGIAMDHPLVDRALKAGVRVIGDIDLFMAEANAPVIGITGSNGKSTVTEMVAAILRASGSAVAVGGNLGTPALDLLEHPADIYVLELSSFQLERSEKLGLAVATVLNISADHLDRHGSMPRYHQAKHRIFRGARTVVANRADPLTVPLLEEKADVVVWRDGEPDLREFGTRVVDGEVMLCRGFDTLAAATELPLPGRHNLANALAAMAVASAAGVDDEQLVPGLKHFHGLPHRCALVRELDGIRFINDSKGTNIGATRAALEGLGGNGNVVLIAGGVGKGQDFTELQASAEQRCRRVLTVGESAREIELALGATVPCQRVETIEQAVTRGRELAKAGDIVLLSPACASFDQFSGYAARGLAFEEAVKALQEGEQ
ncbi:UDP-N-acetylmuramoylalanine--D-glutamate ligase [Luminiphilus syltensis NOR5-1B]|uniref:UDP-N-acetylmuramoylalanine--D-glutamate ligase n=2 Tax=Luminiphilus TaxID=1341118 RepID=B8KR53_9GAMM|nr:UDP-N-acetylmuramoylalanine--D-glutamate ligase [Luminiphilus syltensis NOR5-1B]